jgi:arylsulfatase A-like enzyme
MIACGPGFAGGTVVSELVSLIDLPPTVLTAGGVEPPASMRGRPLQGLVEGTATDWPQEVFLQISESQVGRAIRTERWKYAVYAPEKSGGKDADSDHYVEQFLYDLQADPHERNNLVADPAYAEVRATLVETLKRRMAEAGEEIPRIDPAL